MIRAAVAAVVGLLMVCFSVSAQQANRPRTIDPAFGLSVYQPKDFRSNDTFLLLRKGPVRAWSDGGRLISESAFASVGMGSVELPSSAYLTPNSFGYGPTAKGSAASNQRSGNIATDPKDSPEMTLSPPDRFYYGGEVGFMYGHWSGKGSGDMMESYIMGTAGNDHLQITAGAAFDQWNGNGGRFRSVAFPR
jgi:hypothetical protein